MNVQEFSEVRVFISQEALIRLKKDKFVKENRRTYNAEIFMITNATLSRPTETIGTFRISPRGSKKIRVAWHFSIQKGAIFVYIDDLLYHESNDRYVDNWAQKVQTGRINAKSYGQFVPWIPF